MTLSNILRNARTLFISIVVLFQIFGHRLEASDLRCEQHLGVNGESVFVLPHSGLLMKVHKETGKLEWQTQKTFRLTGPSAAPAYGSCYSSPVFTENRLFCIETLGPELFSVDCNSGNILWEGRRAGVPGCPNLVKTFFKQIIWNDLLLACDNSGIEALNLLDGKQTWTFPICGITDSFQCGSSLYLLTHQLNDEVTESHNTQNSGFTVLELDYSGHVLNKYKQNKFFQDQKIVVGRAKCIGEWRGTKILLVEYYRSPKGKNSAIFSFDSLSKSIKKLLDVKETLWPGRAPLISDDLLFYGSIARNLLTGEVAWAARTREIPYAATKGKLFTGKEGKISMKVTSRDTNNGEILWRSGLKKKFQATTISEMQVSDKCLYVLTTDCLYALDARSGSQVWKIELRPDAYYSSYKKTEETIWNSIIDLIN